MLGARHLGGTWPPPGWWLYLLGLSPQRPQQNPDPPPPPPQVLEELGKGGKYQVPEDFPYQEARRLFKGGRPLRGAGPPAPGLPVHACVSLSAAPRPPNCLSALPAEPDVLKGDQVPQLKWSAPDTGAGARPACRGPSDPLGCVLSSPPRILETGALDQVQSKQRAPSPLTLLQTAWCSSWCTKRHLQRTACARP